MSQTVDNLIVYGDSYSDIHPATKRTNGPVWSQVLASQWNTELVSLAKPGATFCQNNKKNGSWLRKQVEEDTTVNSSDSSNVHVIFLGSTDLVETKGSAKNISEWLKCVKDQVMYLNSNPNSRIIIMGVPAFEFSPYAQTHKQATAELKQNIIDFNVALEEEVLEWSTETSSKIEFFDTYLVFSDVFGDPSVANIENVDDAYWDKCQGKCSEEMNSYLWWDSVHVTGAGHKAIANTIQSKGFFNLQGTEAVSDTAVEDITGIPQIYIRGLSWVILGAILVMIIYMFRHNRIVVSLKKTLQTKAAKIYPSSRSNNHEYTLV